MKKQMVAVLAFAFLSAVSSVFAAPWRFSPVNETTGTITDGDVEITVAVDGDELAMKGGNPANQTCSNGVIDLSDGVDGGYKIIEIDRGCLGNIDGVQKFVAPRTVKRLGTGVFQSSSIADFTFIAPELEEVPQNAFNSCSAIENFVLRIPNATRIREGAFRGMRGTIDAGKLTLKSVEIVEQYAFRDIPNLCGTLDLPSVTNVGMMAFHDIPSIEGIRLRSQKAVTIATGGFGGSAPANLRSVEIGTKEQFTWNNQQIGLFYSARNIFLDGPAQTGSLTLSYLTRGCTDYKTRLIVSQKQDGWANWVQKNVKQVDEADREEKDYPFDLTEAQGFTVLGVYNNIYGKFVWVVNKDSPYDRRPVIIVIR